MTAAQPDSLDEFADTVDEETYTFEEARSHLADLIDKVVASREPIRITGHGAEDAILVAATEYTSLLTTVLLLRTPESARRLFDALERSRRGEFIVIPMEELRRKVGLEPEE